MKLPVAIIFLFYSIQVYGQASAGFKIGGGYYSVAGTGKSEYGPGYEAGFFSKAELGKHASLLLEIDYSARQSKITVKDSATTLELNFASFRIGGTYDFNEQFFAGAGFYFSYMIQPKQKPRLIPDSYFTHFAVGLSPMAGFETGRFAFILKYDLGLTVLTLEETPEAKGNILTGAKFSGAGLIAGVKF